MTRPLRSTDPSRIGGYELIGRIGGGGMGDVFLGRSPGGRLAAVKVVRDLLADDPRFRERFRREVAAARSVSGAYTAAVLDAEPDAERPWLATAYIEGPSLLDRVSKNGPLSAAETRRLGAGLAEALRDIHRAGLVHRDLKPGNVLLAGDGPRLIDFGIIRAEDGEGLTETGYVLGSAGFMAPEQAAGGEATKAADVYALGAVLTYAVTGKGPFGSGPAPGVLLRQASGDRDISAVPEGLRDVVARCLDILPGGRPTTDSLLELLGGNATNRSAAGKNKKARKSVSIPGAKASSRRDAKPAAGSRELDDLLLAGSSKAQNAEIATTPTTLMRAEPAKKTKTARKAGSAGGTGGPGDKTTVHRTQDKKPYPDPVPTRRKVLFTLGAAGAAVAAFIWGVDEMPHGDSKTTGAESPDDGSHPVGKGLPVTSAGGVLGGPVRKPQWTAKVAGRAELLALSGTTLLVQGQGLSGFDTASGVQRYAIGAGTFTDFDNGVLPVVGDTVYDAAYGTGDMIAVRADDGTEVWRVPQPAKWLPSGLVGASEDSVIGLSYIGPSSASNPNGQGLWAVATHGHQQIWNIPISPFDGAPYYNATTDQILLSQPDKYQLTAYDAKSSLLAWVGEDTTTHSAENNAFATALYSHGKTVYWATNRLYAFDEQGRYLWPIGVAEGEGGQFHAVIADDDTVYATAVVASATNESVVAAYKAADGAPLWRAVWPENFYTASLEAQLALGGGNLYIADRSNGILVAVDAKSGKTLWQFNDPSATADDTWSVVADDHYVYVSYGTTVHAFLAS